MLPADRNCFNYQLNETQVKLLKRLANGRVKVYCMPAGTPSDKRCDEITDDFNAVLQLVELGLLNDVSDQTDKFRAIVENYRESENRDVVVVWLNGYGQEMFGRVPWEKYKN